MLFDSYETEQVEVKEELDKCCEKMASATKTQKETAKKLKSRTDVKSALALLTEMTRSLFDRLEMVTKLICFHTSYPK